MPARVAVRPDEPGAIIVSATEPLTVGLDLGGTKFVAALTRPDGSVVRSEKRPTDAGRGTTAVVDDLAACVESLVTGPGARPEAAGVGIAAQVDRRGTVLFAPNLRWRDVPLARELGARLGMRVSLLNDVRAATLAEWRGGAGRGSRDLLCLFVGTGAGGGVVTDGRLVAGASNAAGELGHIALVADGRPCTCGNRGCLEAYVSGWAIADRAREAYRAGATSRSAPAADGVAPDAADVLAAARAGDPVAVAVRDATIGYLASALAGLANAFNPELVIAGGGVFDGDPDLFDEALARARPRMLPPVGAAIRGAHAELGDRAVAIGAALWAREAAA